MTVTNGRFRSSSELITPSAIISEAAGSMCAPSATIRLPRLRMFSMPGFMAQILHYADFRGSKFQGKSNLGNTESGMVPHISPAFGRDVGAAGAPGSAPRRSALTWGIIGRLDRRQIAQ